MNLLIALSITTASVGGGLCLCFYLLRRAQGLESMLWFLEHLFCPLLRVVVLLIVVSQIYPAVDGHSDSFEFWRLLGDGHQLRDIVNILFVAGLLLAFVPVVNHPVIALPLQSMLTIALVFHWQYREVVAAGDLLPSAFTLIKIVAWMALAWFATREISIPLGRLVDRSFTVSGSVRLVADTLYMTLQIPVMLIYAGYLGSLLP